MKLEILQVPDCPNAAVLAARLTELGGAWPDLTVTREIVTTAHDARRLGMTGSPAARAHGTDTRPRPGLGPPPPAARRLGMTGPPTLLADGTDPFARPGLDPSISCRLYRDEQGRAVPAPSLGQLRAALHLPDLPAGT